jgi:hypothetical protein
MSSFSLTKTYNFKYVPKFEGNTSNWNESNSTGLASAAQQYNAVGLFVKEMDRNYIVRPKNTLFSDEDSFDVIKNGDSFVAGGNFKITSVKINVNEHLGKFLNVIKFGMNENVGDIGDGNSFAGSTSGYLRQTFLTEKNADGSYSVLINDDTNAKVDTDIDMTRLFNFWVDGIPEYDADGNIVEPAGWEEDEILHDLEHLVLFEIQVNGYYLNRREDTTNRNILSGASGQTGYQVNIYEYTKKITIFEDDSGSGKLGLDQIAELSITRKVDHTFETAVAGTTLNTFKTRRYYLGQGFLKDADISSYSAADAVNIKSLKVKSGVLFCRKQISKVEDGTTAAADVKYTSFYVVIDDSDVHKLPNPFDNKVYIIESPVDGGILDSQLHVYNSNPL